MQSVFCRWILPLLFPLLPALAAAHEQETQQAQDIVELFGFRQAPLAQPAEPITNASGRNTRLLNGAWNIIVDEHEVGALGAFGGYYYTPPPSETGMELREYSFDHRRQLQVPGDWNTQDERLFRYRGVVWYQRNFQADKLPGQRSFLHFDGVNYAAQVYLNGKPLAAHRGGYVSFDVEATEALVDGDNFLVVRVDAALNESSIPTMRGSDFFKYGGITRDVRLVTVPETFVQQYHVFLDNLESRSLSAWVQLAGPQATHAGVELRIPEAGIELSARADDSGRVEFSFKADQLKLWSPQDPHLYQVEISSSSGDRVSDRIGFRSIETRDKRILLNGEPAFLRGISLHDESILKRGVAFDHSDAEAQLGLVKELGGNFVRLAHYPHNEHTLRLADELGLMVWSEVPLVSLLDWTNEDTLAQALQQLSDNIHRDLNRAAVVMWSIANETMPQTQQRLKLLTQMAETARTIDRSGRPIAAALIGDARREFGKVTRRLVAEMLQDPEITDAAVRARLQGAAAQMIGEDIEAVLDSEIEIMLDDPLGEVVDIIGYNEYFGWYYSTGLARGIGVSEADTRRNIFRVMPDIRFRNAFDKPIIISEFGAGAKSGFQSQHGPATLWSEAYQARETRHQLEMLSANDWVQGMSPWILKDFRTALRSLNGIQDGYNRKGLVSETGEKKQAFEVLRNFYRNHKEQSQ